MKIALTVEYLDGTKEDVEAVFADFVGFERTWSRSVVAFEKELRLTDLAWLAWSALTHRGKTKAKFDPDWIRSVSNVSPQEESEIPLEPSVTIQPTG